MALRTLAMLARWSAQFPDTRMPDSLEGLPAAQHLHLQANDPELFSLLAGTANAELEMAALSGSLPDATLTPEQRIAANNTARVQELVAAQVFGTAGTYSADGTFIPGIQPNLTGQLALLSLAPDIYASEQAKAKPPAQLTEAQQRDATVLMAHGFTTTTTAGAA